MTKKPAKRTNTISPLRATSITWYVEPNVCSRADSINIMRERLECKCNRNQYDLIYGDNQYDLIYGDNQCELISCNELILGCWCLVNA